MAQLDNIIHQSVRLQIMSSLVTLEKDEQVNFSYLKKMLKLTDGNLGAHLNRLEEAGYIKLEKTFVAKKPCTFINPTGKGRDAFDEHIKALREIIQSDKG